MSSVNKIRNKTKNNKMIMRPKHMASIFTATKVTYALAIKRLTKRL